MIEIIPAIDLIDGKFVRLSKGDFNTKKVYGSNPLDMALFFEDAGFTRLHLVDLEGASSGRLKHLRILERIAVKTSLKVDYGGGVRSMDDVRSILDYGAFLVCIGSMAVKREEEFDKVLAAYGPQIILLAADSRDEKLIVSAWKESAGISVFDYLDKMTKKGISQVLCTDAARDGMLEGVSLRLYGKMVERYPDLYLIASGGVSGIKDIEMLERSAVPAVVFGKAFYEGRLKIEDLKQLMKK